jgi:hypothetical protein
MRLLLIILAIVSAAGSALGAPVPRPESGWGVLALQPEPGAERGVVVLYQEPGVQRLGEVDVARLPRLAGSDSEPVVSATARKLEWTRLSYDDAGREAWVETRRAWRYQPWHEFLTGRAVRVLPGMKKALYAVRSRPAEGAAEMAALRRDQEVRVLRVESDWALLEAPMGWFKWRDGDGRLTVALQPGS